MIEATTDRWQPVFKTAALTGARISEVLGLTWGAVDFSDQQLTISISKQLDRHGKLVRTKTNNSVRKIRGGTELRQVLLTQYMSSPDKSLGGFVFADADGNPPRYGFARTALADAVAAAGIQFDPETQRIGFHGYRHGAVSALIAGGVDPARVAKYIGDTVQTVLETYCHAFENREENIGEILGSVMMGGRG